MNSFQKRFVMFMFGCMVLRSILVIIANKIDPKYLPYMGYIALLPAIGMLVIFLFGLRKTGAEVLGDKIWWDKIRPLHSLFYFAFAYLAITKNKNAWLALLADLLLGFTGFVVYHGTQGDFSMLLTK